MNKHIFKTKKWKKRDQILFLERLELYISSGLTIDRALLCIENSSRKKHALTIEKIRNEIISGQSLSSSISTNIGLSRTLSNLIEQGNISGQLSKMLSSSYELLEKEEELYKKCLSALMYPCIIGLFSCILMIGLVKGVMPQIIPMLKSLNIQLPLLTRFTISISENLLSYGLYLFFIFIILITSHLYLYKKVSQYKNSYQNLLIHIPILGGLIYSYSLFILLRSCGVLIESGLTANRAFIETSSNISLYPLSKLINEQAESYHKGKSLGLLLYGKSKNIPNYIPSLIIAGEASGMLGISLIRASAILDRDLDYSLRRLTSLVEPIMMIGMGLIVGGIALSIMLPIYDVSKILQQQ